MIFSLNQQKSEAVPWYMWMCQDIQEMWPWYINVLFLIFILNTEIT